MDLKTVRATVALGVAGLLVLTATAWFTLVGPLVGEIGRTGEAQTEAQDQNDTKRLQLVSLRRQAEDLPTTHALADEVEAVWPPTADQPAFFAQVSEAAAAAGIAPDDLTTLSPGVPTVVLRDAEGNPLPATGSVADAEATVTSRSVAVQTVAISVTGDYDQLARLLERLERMPRALLTSSVELATQENGFDLTVTGSTFVAPPLTRPEDTGS